MSAREQGHNQPNDENSLIMELFYLGDNEAFNLLITKTQCYVFNIVSSMITERNLARLSEKTEDVVQAVYTEVADKRNKGTFQPCDKSFKGFRRAVGLIARSRCKDRYPKLKRKQTISFDSDSVNMLAASLTGVVDLVIDSEDRERLAKVLSSLEANDRALLKLRYVEGRTFEKIKEEGEYGSIETIRRRIVRIIIDIRRRLKE